MKQTTATTRFFGTRQKKTCASKSFFFFRHNQTTHLLEQRQSIQPKATIRKKEASKDKGIGWVGGPVTISLKIIFFDLLYSRLQSQSQSHIQSQSKKQAATHPQHIPHSSYSQSHLVVGYTGNSTGRRVVFLWECASYLSPI